MQSFRIPAIVLITAFVMALLGVAGWSLRLERTKADKEDVQMIQADVKEIRTDVKELIRRR